MSAMQPSHSFPYNQNPGQYRSPYSQFPFQPSPHSLQSMTSHWNLPAPSSMHHHQAAGGGGGGMSAGKGSNKNQGPGVLKPPKAPEKPLLPYMRYSRKMWEEFKKTEGTDLKVWEVGKIIGQKWRELGEEDKQPYFEEYEQEKGVYDELMKQYRNSTAYKQYLEAKKMADKQAHAAAHQSTTNQDTMGLNNPFPAPPPIIVPPRGSSDPRILMLQQQQQEEDEEDEYLTTKQLAAVRFHRNHRLMGEIFSDFVVPDLRKSISDSRLETLKAQSKSLENPLKNLEDEVATMEMKYINKRARFLDDAERFRRELRKIQENPPTTWKKPQIQLSSKDIPEPIKSAKFVKL